MGNDIECWLHLKDQTPAFCALWFSLKHLTYFINVLKLTHVVNLLFGITFVGFEIFL
jgi:hypothetical protein